MKTWLRRFRRSDEQQSLITQTFLARSEHLEFHLVFQSSMGRERRPKRYALELRRKLSYAEVQDVYLRLRERDRKEGSIRSYTSW